MDKAILYGGIVLASLGGILWCVCVVRMVMEYRAQRKVQP